MRFRLLGRWWKFRYSRTLRDKWGYCNWTAREVVVDDRNRNDQHLLDVTLHELLHAASDTLSEEFVEQAATDISRVLVRLGWSRRTEKEAREQ